MYLKSIEVYGFKSFAQKTRFEFHRGITAIVGPNGSGKSNVADAVRWVLGEQKVRQLRSQSMQDVIFAGTKDRRPLGYAFVSLTLDNSDHKLPADFDEVTVSRKVFRSGESEYRINGRSCRLRDVQELFYDTGIGKEGYSIIGQGQIDRILSGRADERRALFDEAAGIVKYKRRKAESQKKLQDEEANLLRINDILQELEKQLDPLKKQAEAAKKYLKQKKLQKTYEVNLFLLQTKSDQSRYQEIESGLQEESAQLERIRRLYAQTGGDYQKVQDRLSQLEEQLEALQQNIGRFQTQRQQKENEIRLFDEQIRALCDENKKNTERLKDTEDEAEKKQKNRSECENTLQSLQQKRQEVRKNLQQLQQERERLCSSMNKAESLQEETRKKKMDLLEKRGQLQTEEQRLKTLTQQAKLRQTQLNQELIRHQTGSGDMEKLLKKNQTEYQKLTDAVQKKKTRLEAISASQRKLQQDLKQCEKTLDHDREEYHRLSSRRDVLSSVVERYEGYNSSIRHVMEQKKRVPGLVGVVADLIRTKPEYETAIETALGGSIQNVVTDNADTARKMIRFLKQNHFGRATFLPMTDVSAPDRVPARRALKDEGALGMADQLVVAGKPYRNIVAHLLGRTLVVDTIDHAVSIARAYHHSIRIVTLGGELIQPGGAMTGGAFRNRNALLGRRRQIDELDRKVTDIREKAGKAKKQLDEIQEEAESIQKEQDELKQKLQEDYILQNTAGIRMKQLTEDLKKDRDLYSGLQKDREEIRNQLKDLKDQQQKLQSEEAGRKQNEAETDIQSDHASEEIERSRQKIQKLDDEISGLRLKENELGQKQEFLRQNLKRLEEEADALKQEKKALEKSLKENQKQISRKQKQIEDTKVQLARESDSDRENQNLREKLLAEKKDLSGQEKDLIQKREEYNQKISICDQKVFRLTVQKENAQKEYEERTSYLWSEYELTEHEARAFRDPQYSDIAGLQQLIGNTKRTIRNLGPVNTGAVEEYQKVSERFSFMQTQRDDLLRAKKSLTDIIDRLDRGMRRQFKEKFSEIEQKFNEVFRELFGGGSGKLQLEQGEDVLEGNIGITAQPPGKKLQNMMQLSGGEKALTAIALLFAIQALKPSPFCLLDEIEAALDDSNVDRFAGYLHKLTDHTQFIVITHRRGTMMAADRLYGITMQEKGVSTQVSVSLIESDLED